MVDATEGVAGAVDWLSGACLLVRREAFDAVGGFSPRFFMYFEEVDLARRLAALGWETWYEPAATVVHHHGRSADQDVAARDRHYYGSKYRYAGPLLRRRHRRCPAPDRRCPLRRRGGRPGAPPRSAGGAALRRARPLALLPASGRLAMRIGLISGEYPPGVGGIGDHTARWPTSSSPADTRCR
jgi:N-acetylglucosaminyl-diphospho-decaprenol L-rhamnosyltransferase